MFKILATDVDGTLLDNNSELPEENKKAVISCKAKDIDIVLATGKSIYGIKDLIEKLDLTLPQITMHGAVIFGRDLQVKRSSRVDPRLYMEVVRSIKDRGHTVLTGSTEGTIYYDRQDSKIDIFRDIGEKIEKVESIESDFFAEDCVCMTTPITEQDPLDRYLREKFSSVLQVVRSGEFYFDILDKRSTKGNALEYLSGILSVGKDQIAAIGDSPNDISLFQSCGFSIAVANAYEEVKKIADVVVSSNADLGFAEAVKRYILK